MDEKKRPTGDIWRDIEAFAMTMTQFKSRIDKLMGLVLEHAISYLEENWRDKTMSSGEHVHEDDIDDFMGAHADDLSPKDESRD